MSNFQIRTEEELQEIKKACLIADSTISFALKEIDKNTSEKDLAKKVSSFIRKSSGGLSFRPIVAFGENTSNIHHKPTDLKVKEKDIIMLDVGARINGFCSDITRTIFIGKPSTEMIKAYKTVLKSQEKVVEYVNKNFNKHLKAEDIDKVARDFIRSKGFPSIPHSLGHGIGRKVHQSPRISPNSKSFLKKGMVFTIEPAVYLGHFGIRIEDIFFFSDKGLKPLTKSKKEIIVLYLK